MTLLAALPSWLVSRAVEELVDTHPAFLYNGFDRGCLVVYQVGARHEYTIHGAVLGLSAGLIAFSLFTTLLLRLIARQSAGQVLSRLRGAAASLLSLRPGLPTAVRLRIALFVTLAALAAQIIAWIVHSLITKAVNSLGYNNVETSVSREIAAGLVFSVFSLLALAAIRLVARLTLREVVVVYLGALLGLFLGRLTVGSTAGILIYPFVLLGFNIYAAILLAGLIAPLGPLFVAALLATRSLPPQSLRLAALRSGLARLLSLRPLLPTASRLRTAAFVTLTALFADVVMRVVAIVSMHRVGVWGPMAYRAGLGRVYWWDLGVGAGFVAFVLMSPFAIRLAARLMMREVFIVFLGALAGLLVARCIITTLMGWEIVGILDEAPVLFIPAHNPYLAGLSVGCVFLAPLLTTGASASTP